MWKFLRGGATFIPGGTSIPESRVNDSTFATQNLGRKKDVRKLAVLPLALLSITEIYISF